MRQMIVCFAVFCAMKWRESFHDFLSTISPIQLFHLATP